MRPPSWGKLQGLHQYLPIVDTDFNGVPGNIRRLETSTEQKREEDKDTCYQ